MSLEQITIGVLPKCTGLDEVSAGNYFSAIHSSQPLLEGRIIDPFKELLKQQTGYGPEHLPPAPVTQSFKYGNITFTIDSSKRTKRPEWKEVFEGLVDYLKFIDDGHKNRVQRKGVRAFMHESLLKPYISIEDVLKRLGELSAEVTVDELKQTKPKLDFTVQKIEPVVVPLSTEITLTEGNALLYVMASALAEYLHSEVIKPFEDRLKNETGYSNDNVPDNMQRHTTQVGKYLFEVKTIPRRTPQYAEVITDITKEPPERITSRSRIGDLERIRRGLPLDTELYDPKNAVGNKGNEFISVRGMLQRLEELKARRTSAVINQPIMVYPIN